MNWVIRKTEKLSCHTDLNGLLKPIYDQINKYNWLLSDLEFNGSDNFAELPVNYEEDYFILSPPEFKRLVDTDIQTIWGVILGIPTGKDINIDENKLPYADGNGVIWEEGNIQHPNAEIEIVCYDSSYTIVKFTDNLLSNKFKAYFDEAIDLKKFTSKW